MVKLKRSLCRNLIVVTLLSLILSSILDTQYLSLVHTTSTTVTPNAEVMGISSTSGSLPVQVRSGSVIEATVFVKNTGETVGTFYVGASIIGEGENVWKDLPDWGTTFPIEPDEIGTYTLGEYTIPSTAYFGYHGIVAKVWADASKNILLAERWFPRVVAIGDLSHAKIVLSFDFESDDESYKSTGYISQSTLNGMNNIIFLLEQNNLPATIFVQGVCLENPQSGDEFKDVITIAASSGLEIASHTYSHPPDINSLSTSEIETELSDTEYLLEALTGRKPIGFRAPYFASGERVWNALADKGYEYDSSVWQHEPAVYTIQTPSGLLTQVPWKHQDGDTSYSDLSQSIEYAAKYEKTRVIDFHPQTVKEHWGEFQEFITLLASLRSTGTIDVMSIAQLVETAPLPWEDRDRDSIQDYLDHPAFTVSSLEGRINLFNYNWYIALHVITPSSSREEMLSALQEEGVKNLGSYTHVVPVVVDVNFPFPNVDELLVWLASRGLVDYGTTSQFKSQIESLFSSDGHMRIALILQWNDVSDWDIDYYLIKDYSPIVWKLFLLTFIIECAPVFVSVAACAYRYLEKNEPLNPQDVLDEALALTLQIVVMQIPFFGVMAKGIVWSITASKSVTDLLMAIRDPTLDLHMYDSKGNMILGVDYETGMNLTTSEYGIYFGSSSINQYIIATKPKEDYIIKVVSQSSEATEYYLHGMDLTTNNALFSSGSLIPGESTNGRVYLHNNEVYTTRLITSATISDSSLQTTERAVLTIHVSNENGTSVSDANIRVHVNQTSLNVNNRGDGFYESIIDGSHFSPGTYDIKVLANKAGLLQDATSLTITLQAPLQATFPSEILLLLIPLASVLVFLIRKRKNQPTRGS